jgi:peptidoglycan/LPS O-acetylase OafA/YrhL
VGAHLVGLIRFLLAAAVVITHSRPVFGLTLTGGLVSVQAFFIISGFYMALILKEKYTGLGAYKTFLVNRFLRLYPGYYIVMLAYSLPLVVVLIQHRNFGPFNAYAEYANELPFSSLLFPIFANLAIFGQDVIMFLKFSSDSHALQFTTTFWTSTPRVHQFLVLPQAWSLAIELTFYLLVPFIVRLKTIYLIGLTGVSLLLRLFMFSVLGLNTDPWTGRFFPTELALFLFGVLSYRLGSGYRLLKIPTIVPKIAFYSCVLLIVFFPQVQLNEWIFYAYLILAIPMIFDWTKKNRFDRIIGDLSYPIYISHLLVLWVLAAKIFYDSIGDRYIAICTIAGSVVVSIMVNMITKPIEEYRQRRVRSRETTSGLPAKRVVHETDATAVG